MPRQLWGEFVEEEKVSQNEESKTIPLGAKRMKLTEIQSQQPAEVNKR